MDYLFRQHYTMNPGMSVASSTPMVLLAEPEPEALALYARHLSRADLLVSVCLEARRLPYHVQEAQPHLLVINPMPDLALSLNMLEYISQLQPGLPVITVGTAIPDHYLDRLMSLGVSLHINRSLSQPRDIVIAARQILGY
jgi:DNA-binding NtrC family response regulator